jgi:hypothetical protein
LTVDHAIAIENESAAAHFQSFLCNYNHASLTKPANQTLVVDDASTDGSRDPRRPRFSARSVERDISVMPGAAWTL